MAAFPESSSLTHENEMNRGHGLNDFLDRIRTLKVNFSMDNSVLSMIDYASETDDKKSPLSFLIELETIETLKRLIQENSPNENNVYGFIAEITKLIPGFPGGGRSFIEIPIDVNINDISDVLQKVKKVVQKFRNVFKYDQKTERCYDFVLSDDGNEIVDIDFLACLPENGGSPQIDIGIKYISNKIVLIISVDSYWQPAIDSFILSYNIAKIFSFEKEKNHDLLAKKTNYDKNTEDLKKKIYDEIRDSLIRSIENKSIYHIENEKKDDMKIDFNIINFTYCEYMSYLHRNAVLTKLVGMIKKIKLENKPETWKMIPNFKNENVMRRFFFPSISKEMARLYKNKRLCTNEDGQIYIQLLHQRYIKNAFHTTIRKGINECNDLVVFFTKRQFLRNDFFNGNAIMLYGEHGGFVYHDCYKKKKDYDLTAGNNRFNFVASKSTIDPFFLSENLLKHTEDFFSGDFLFNPNSISETLMIEQERDFICADILKYYYLFQNDDHDENEKYGLKYQHPKEVSLEVDSKEVICFQLYQEEIGLKSFYADFEDPYLSEMIINEYLKNANEDNKVFFNNLSRAHVVINPICISIQCVTPIEKIPLKELITFQINRNESKKSIHGKSDDYFFIVPLDTSIKDILELEKKLRTKYNKMGYKIVINMEKQMFKEYNEVIRKVKHVEKTGFSVTSSYDESKKDEEDDNYKRIYACYSYKLIKK